MELVNTDFQCNGHHPWEFPSPSMALGSLAYKAHSSQEGSNPPFLW